MSIRSRLDRLEGWAGTGRAEPRRLLDGLAIGHEGDRLWLEQWIAYRLILPPWRKTRSAWDESSEAAGWAVVERARRAVKRVGPRAAADAVRCASVLSVSRLDGHASSEADRAEAREHLRAFAASHPGECEVFRVAPDVVAADDAERERLLDEFRPPSPRPRRPSGPPPPLVAIIREIRP